MEILKDDEAMERVANLTMEYHLARGQSLDHLLHILQDLQFQIDFLHSDGQKMAGSALAEISNALTGVSLVKAQSSSGSGFAAT